METGKNKTDAQKSKKRAVVAHFRNSVTAREEVPIGDINEMDSMTEPNQVLSLKEIIERFASGIDMSAHSYDPLYTDEELPDFEHMSFDELHEYREHLSNERYRLEQKLKEETQSLKQQRAKRKTSVQSGTEPTEEKQDSGQADPSVGQ